MAVKIALCKRYCGYCRYYSAPCHPHSCNTYTHDNASLCLSTHLMPLFYRFLNYSMCACVRVIKKIRCRLMFDDLQLRSWIAFAFIFLRFRITNQIKKVDNLVLKIIFSKSNQFRLVHIFVCTDGTNQLILFVKKDNFPNRIV